MKIHHAYFIFIQIILTIQVALVYLKKQTTTSTAYVLTDTIFKISIALYLFLFLWLYPIEGLAWEEAAILRFSGVILLYDIDYTGLINILKKWFPNTPIDRITNRES